MQLEVSVRKQQGDFHLAADFHLTGRRVGLFGPSGSGKSTLMHLIAGLRSPDSGTIRLDGRVLFDSRTGIDLKPEERRIGVVFQHARLFPHLGVRRNLLYGWRRTPAAERQIEPEAIIRVLHLDHLLDRGVNLLSGGERQRVALGRTLLTCPRLILMDEPLSGLDEGLKLQIVPYLNAVFSRFAIPLLFISHSLEEMRLMTEQVLVVERGAVQQQLPTESLAPAAGTATARGVVNRLRLGRPEPQGPLWSYPWGELRLLLDSPAQGDDNLFTLDGREILLCSRHPGATGGANLLACTVAAVHDHGPHLRVELQCGAQQLSAQLPAHTGTEPAMVVGQPLFALIRAGAFQPPG